MTPIEGFDLSGHNTLGLPSRALYGGVISDIGDIMRMIEFARARYLPFHVLGGGSNCVLAETVNAVVGRIDLPGWRIEQGFSGGVRVTACAGEDWSDLVRRTVGQGIGGLENLAGIPGTVGAAPIQNIGAYGIELSDVFQELTALDTRTGDLVHLGKDACRFAYRHSRFKDEPGRYIVTEVTLSLPRHWQPVLSHAGLKGLPDASDPGAIMAAVLAIRGAKLPDWRITGNVGSFFHNPIVPAHMRQEVGGVPGHPVPGGIKLSAGWLIEACGLKGHRLGGAGFHAKHALVIVNHGGATFGDVQDLAALAIQRVRDRFGVTLVQEPVTLT